MPTEHLNKLTSIVPAARLSRLPAYIFVRLDELKQKARESGLDLIDLGLGNPDQPTPEPIVTALAKAAHDQSVHGYPPFDGRPELKAKIAEWMHRRYAVNIDPTTESLPLPGSKEGLAHLALAYLDKDDIALVPSPCYPVHLRGPVLAGATVYEVPLSKEEFLPAFDAIPHEVASQAKMLIINYPNNPTGATAPANLLQEAVEFCRKHGILLVHDFAYGELYFGKCRPKSILEFPGAKEIAVEFHTFSKTFNMAGWRVGFAVGNADVIKTLYALKTNIDYGVFGAVQKAAIAALELSDNEIEKIRNTYRTRRDLLVEGLRAMGWQVRIPEASMYIWLHLPRSLGMLSTEFAEKLLTTAGVVVTPGAAFGRAGEEYVRISMVADEERLQEALERWRHTGLVP
jgi:LL-diaminopimelate aminotransferase